MGHINCFESKYENDGSLITKSNDLVVVEYLEDIVEILKIVECFKVCGTLVEMKLVVSVDK